MTICYHQTDSSLYVWSDVWHLVHKHIYHYQYVWVPTSTLKDAFSHIHAWSFNLSCLLSRSSANLPQICICAYFICSNTLHFRVEHFCCELCFTTTLLCRLFRLTSHKHLTARYNSCPHSTGDVSSYAWLVTLRMHTALDYQNLPTSVLVSDEVLFVCLFVCFPE